MAERPTEFSFIPQHPALQIRESRYGGVCKAQCDGLLCAAKIMHPTLFDLHDPGTASYLRKFREECHLLSLARHPNIVQYLGTYTDPDTRLPVLLMELCDESLTAFLERSPGPLSYHIQVNICHDIALALVYLYSNGLIHRDLTGNNILMVTGPRAKITDFGMSKPASMIMASIQCPGNSLYMSPESLDEAKSYTAKLDIFSFGVIVIQILTRLFPNPTDRIDKKEMRQVIPETERCQSHLQLTPDTHHLKKYALQCINQSESPRPSALQLRERLFELKQTYQYRECRKQAETSDDIIEGKTQEANKEQTHITEVEKLVVAKNRRLHDLQNSFQESNRQLQAKDRQLQHTQSAVAALTQALERKERELQQTREQLRGSEQVLSEFQESLQHKDKTITELQRTISEQERKIQQLEQGDTASRDTPPQRDPVDTRQTTVAAGLKDVSKMRWREGKNVPRAMIRGAAVVHGNTAYFSPSSSRKVYSYHSTKDKWFQLPDNCTEYFGLAVIDGLLTSVGGWNSGGATNTLLSLRGGERKQWSQILPPMPTPRWSVACVTTEQALVVAGGFDGNYHSTVEVMSSDNRFWTKVASLPENCSLLTAAVFEDKLYLAEGVTSLYASKSVFTCSLPDLLTVGVQWRPSLHPFWRNINSLPVTLSTLVSFGGHLLAVCGRDDSDNPTSEIYRYDSHTDSWTLASTINNKRSHCFAATLSDDKLNVVGGNTDKRKHTSYNITQSVEILQYIDFLSHSLRNLLNIIILHHGSS